MDSSFKSFGSVRYARIVMDPITKRSRGTGFVSFYKEVDALACLEEAERIALQTGAPTNGSNVSAFGRAIASTFS